MIGSSASPTVLMPIASCLVALSTAKLWFEAQARPRIRPFGAGGVAEDGLCFLVVLSSGRQDYGASSGSWEASSCRWLP